MRTRPLAYRLRRSNRRAQKAKAKMLAIEGRTTEPYIYQQWVSNRRRFIHHIGQLNSNWTAA